MKRGYFPLYRKFQDHPFWKEKRVFSKAEAWIDLLWEAQHNEFPEEVLIGLKILICNYGESLKSIRTWGKRWRWSEKKVWNYFQLLKKMRQIDTDNETVTTRLTILNYKQYDPRKMKKETEKETVGKQSGNSRETRGNTDKNVKNVKKNTKKKFIPPELQAVIQFFTENKYTEESAIQAFKYYADGDPPWTDSRGNQVRGWKQKMRGVWFKPENIIKKKGNTPPWL